MPAKKSAPSRPAPGRRPPGRTTQTDPDALTPQQACFVAVYQANGGNGTRAYLEAYPLTRSNNTAAVESCRLLREPKIARRILAQRTARLERFRMEADEALLRIAAKASADIGDAYGDDGRLLPVHEWPEQLRLCVKGIKPGPYGDTITLHDGLRAAELIAISGGKLRAGLDVNHTFDHEAYLAGKTPEPKA